MCPGFDSRTRRHMWVEFVVSFLLCSERFFSGYYGFPLSSKNNIFKFQCDPGMHGHFWKSSCELLGAPWVNKLHTLHLAIKEKKRTFKTHCEGKVLCQWCKFVQEEYSRDPSKEKRIIYFYDAIVIACSIHLWNIVQCFIYFDEFDQSVHLWNLCSLLWLSKRSYIILPGVRQLRYQVGCKTLNNWNNASLTWQGWIQTDVIPSPKRALLRLRVKEETWKFFSLLW